MKIALYVIGGIILAINTLAALAHDSFQTGFVLGVMCICSAAIIGAIESIKTNPPK